MALEYSSIVSIIYFSVNILFLSVLGVIVYKQGGHAVKTKLRTKSYFKDFWNQRKIYAPLVIHFYDTATDIGVIYNWHQLMQKEQNNDAIDYESVDMTVFFWSGISFLAVYRFCLLCWSLYEWLIADDGEWYYPLLVLCDLYIFVAVYESFAEARGIISANAAKRQRNAEKRAKEREEKRNQLEEMAKTAETQDSNAEIAAYEEEKEVEPAQKQFAIQLGEAITESMPQIVLQSVFIIRSANDDELLKSGSNVALLLLSIIASLFSISNKYASWDKEDVYEMAHSLKPRLKCPQCIQYWYIARILWRMSQVMSRFCVFVLVWVVMGGAWLPIWGCSVWMYWIVVMIVVSTYNPDNGEKQNCTEMFGMILIGLIFVIGLIPEKDKHWAIKATLMAKIMESVIGLALVTIFGMLTFDCGICSDPVTRQILNDENPRILIFWILGLISAVLDPVLLLAMLRRGVF